MLLAITARTFDDLQLLIPEIVGDNSAISKH
jgi:hypothetical protein